MAVLIENTETGEVREVAKGPDGRYPLLHTPWRLKGDPSLVRRKTAYEKHVHDLNSRVAAYAQKLGLPVADFLDTARWLLDKDCPFCQVATRVLRRIGELGDEKAIDVLNRIQAAKAANDHEALAAIRLEIRDVVRQ